MYDVKPDTSGLEIINPLDHPDWDDLILTTKDYSFFHSSIWARVLHESYGYQPLFFSRLQNKRISVLLPLMEIKSILTGKRGVSLPFSDYCKPIVNDANDFQEALDHLIRYGKSAGWRSFEIRDGEYFTRDIPCSSSYYIHRLELSRKEGEIFSGFRDSVRRNINKAKKEGLIVDISNSLESINDFYKLNCMTRKRHGLPPQPYYFFKKVYEHIISKAHGFVALASCNQRVIAGAVYFHFGDKAIYKYGASDETYQHLRANNLIMWRAIEWFARKGCRDFSLGRTDFDNDGLRNFKRGWGTEESVVKYYKYDLSKRAFIAKSPKGSQVPQKIFRRLPQVVLRTTGSLLYRHIG